MGYWIFGDDRVLYSSKGGYGIYVHPNDVRSITLKRSENNASVCTAVLNNANGKNTDRIMAHDEVEVYYPYKNHFIKIFTGNRRSSNVGTETTSVEILDMLSFLATEYVTETKTYSGVDVGLVLKDVLKRSTWDIDTKHIDDNVGVNVDSISFTNKTRKDAIKTLIDLANSGDKSYHIRTDEDNVIYFERFDDRSTPKFFFTTEDEIDKGVFLNYKSGAQGLWMLDEGSGTSADDSSGNNNDGTVSGNASWSKDSMYTDYSFKLVNDGNYIDCGNSSTLELSGSFTIIVIINPTSSGSSGYVINKSNFASGACEIPPPPHCQGYAVYYNASSKTAYLTVADSSGDKVTSPTISADAGEWAVIAFTWDSTSDTLKGFKDGVLQFTSSVGDTSLNTSSSGFYIGSDDPLFVDMSRSFDGLVEFVLVDDVCYTDSEIAALVHKYTNGLITRLSKNELESEYYNAVLEVGN